MKPHNIDARTLDRPSLLGPSPASVTVRVSGPELQLIHDSAQAGRVTVSAWVREAITRRLIADAINTKGKDHT